MRNLFKNVGVVLFTFIVSASFSEKKNYDGGRPGVESSQIKNLDFDLRPGKSTVKTRKGNVYGRRSIMIKEERSLVGVVRQLLWKKSNEPWR